MAAPFVRTCLYMFGGLILWAIRFLLVYAVTAVACSRGWAWSAPAGGPGGVGPAALSVALISLAAAGGCAALLLTALRRLRGAPLNEAEGNRWFVHAMAATTAGLSLLAIFWETVPFLLIPVCA